MPETFDKNCTIAPRQMQSYDAGDAATPDLQVPEESKRKVVLRATCSLYIPAPSATDLLSKLSDVTQRPPTNPSFPPAQDDEKQGGG
jgi:hypothetical protein